MTCVMLRPVRPAGTRPLPQRAVRCKLAPCCLLSFARLTPRNFTASFVLCCDACAHLPLAASASDVGCRARGVSEICAWSYVSLDAFATPDRPTLCVWGMLFHTSPVDGRMSHGCDRAKRPHSRDNSRCAALCRCTAAAYAADVRFVARRRYLLWPPLPSRGKQHCLAPLAEHHRDHPDRFSVRICAHAVLHPTHDTLRIPPVTRSARLGRGVPYALASWTAARLASHACDARVTAHRGIDEGDRHRLGLFRLPPTIGTRIAGPIISHKKRHGPVESTQMQDHWLCAGDERFGRCVGPGSPPPPGSRNSWPCRGARTQKAWQTRRVSGVLRASEAWMDYMPQHLPRAPFFPFFPVSSFVASIGLKSSRAHGPGDELRAQLLAWCAPVARRRPLVPQSGHPGRAPLAGCCRPGATAGHGARKALRRRFQSCELAHASATNHFALASSPHAMCSDVSAPGFEMCYRRLVAMAAGPRSHPTAWGLHVATASAAHDATLSTLQRIAFSARVPRTAVRPLAGLLRAELQATDDPTALAYYSSANNEPVGICLVLVAQTLATPYPEASSSSTTSSSSSLLSSSSSSSGITMLFR
ncbi:hypothetical protein FH972_021534 [Carpinus fangiana]|uniref:Uncharacterized protein n=1 Tax=Carpinus fangiana TaxID=176857 RepID=A0A5N6KPK8_9ROSI|nr:hypothetical protein FH972_021534 [Carpinus fangiana]